MEGDTREARSKTCRFYPLKMKRAALIGLNYYNTLYQLNGCVNDVIESQKQLAKRGFSFVSVLTDSPENKVTRSQILAALDALIKDASPGDFLVLLYSGHGGQVPTSKETDGMNECIFDSDLTPILDDELKRQTVDRLSAGVRIYFHFDCCHSGSILDLPFTYRIRENREMKKLSFWGEMLAYAKTVPPMKHEASEKSWTSILQMLLGKVSVTQESRSKIKPEALLLSGCKDEEVSFDAYFETPKGRIRRPVTPRGMSGGAMTYYFWKLINDKPGITMYELLKQLNLSLRASGFNQKPQLTSSRDGIDIISTPFWLA